MSGGQRISLEGGDTEVTRPKLSCWQITLGLDERAAFVCVFSDVLGLMRARDRKNGKVPNTFSLRH